METERTDLVRRLSGLVEALENRQTLLGRAIASFKKGGGASDLFAARLWIENHGDIVGRDVPEFSIMAKEIGDACKDMALRLEADMQDAAKSQGWTISGQWPTYYVENIVPVIVDDKQFSVIVGDEKIPTFSIKAIIISLSNGLKRAKVETAKLPDFLKEVYDAACRLTTPQHPTVSIWDVYKEIVIGRQNKRFWRDASPANFRPFRELEFKSHLTELLKNEVTSISGFQMKLLPPISKEESVFIYQPYENRFCHVGRIQFTPTG